MVKENNILVPQWVLDEARRYHPETPQGHEDIIAIAMKAEEQDILIMHE